MAFSSVLAGSQMVASQVSQIIDALSGTAGAGQAIVLTKLNDTSAYALDVANADSTNSYGLRVQDSAGNNLLLVYKNNVTIGASAANDTMTINANISGKVYIGDSANAKMTAGLTINQGANDDEILALKSSDVAHGVTNDTETDTYGTLLKAQAADGGLLVKGYSEGGQALILSGVSVTEDATRSTTGRGVVELTVAKKSGTGAAILAGDKNMIGFRLYDVTKFIFDSDGDSHEDGTGWTAYDDHDDVALLDMCNTVMLKAGDPIKQEFWAWAGENAKRLQDLKLITFNGDGHHFVNRSKMQELLVGAIRQLGQQHAALRADLTEMRQKILPEVA